MINISDVVEAQAVVEYGFYSNSDSNYGTVTLVNNWPG
jgi:hypothetical protein